MRLKVKSHKEGGVTQEGRDKRKEVERKVMADVLGGSEV